MRKIISKSVKYLIVSLVNLFILSILLALWTDDLEMTFHPLVRPVEFLKILFFSFLSLIIVRIYSLYLRKKCISKPGTKIKGAVILTVLVSSYLYIDYIRRFASNALTNGAFRDQLAEKIRPSNTLANGTKASGLNLKEYQMIAALTGFPPLPPTAHNIRYEYAYDGFLPDYSLDLVYDVSLETPVVTYDRRTERFQDSQSVRVIGTIKRVTHSEGQF